MSGHTPQHDRRLTRESLMATLGWISRQLKPEQRVYADILDNLVAALANPTPPDGCRRCGEPIPTSRMGRPRKYCTTCSPPKAGKVAENSTTRRG